MCNVNITGRFWKLAEADESGKGRVFAVDTSAHNGTKQFLTLKCTNSIKRKYHVCDDSHMKFFTEKNRHMYERIQKTYPVRMFFDLDKPWSDGEIRTKDIISTLRNMVDHDTRFDKVVVLDSHKQGVKYSQHVIFPDAVFLSITYAKSIAIRLNEILQTNDDDECQHIFVDKNINVKTPIDLSVYTKNRLFRMIGQSKRSKDGKAPSLVLNTTLSTGNVKPLDTMIQCHESFVAKDKIDNDWVASVIGSERQKSHACLIRPREKRAAQDTDIQEKKYDPYKDKHVKWCPKKQKYVPVKSIKTITIKSDADVLQYLLPGVLTRTNDFTGDYLPLVKSLLNAGTIPRPDIERWMNHRSEDKTNAVIDYASKNVVLNENTRCYTAIKHLKANYNAVIDDRDTDTVRFSRIDTDEDLMYPTKSNGWTPVQSGDDLRCHMQKVGDKDRKFENTENEKRRLTFITGRMGVGKTKGTIAYAKDQLLKGNFQRVVYIAPRTVLVDQVADFVETLECKTSRRKHITVQRYYGESEDKLRYMRAKQEAMKKGETECRNQGKKGCCKDKISAKEQDTRSEARHQRQNQRRNHHPQRRNGPDTYHRRSLRDA